MARSTPSLEPINVTSLSPLPSFTSSDATTGDDTVPTPRLKRHRVIFTSGPSNRDTLCRYCERPKAGQGAPSRSLDVAVTL